MENTYLEELSSLLQSDERLVNQDGKLLKTKITELAQQLDTELVKLLLNNSRLKKFFFKDIDGALIFDQEKFLTFVHNEAFLADSYTAFKNKIGLATSKNDYISERNEIVLNWPYKDCILEGGQNKEDEKRDEVFWNETLGADQQDVLLTPKVLGGFKKYDKDGEHEVKELTEDDNFIIRGNNLLVLHTLKKRYLGKVKLIYIDPPYNKDNDSFYNDSFKRSTWLTFMKNRFEIARDLLTNDGIILIQIDITQQHYLGVLLDEIFQSKPISLISIKVKSPSGDSSKSEGYLEDVSEYIYVYSKSSKVKNIKPITIKEIVDENSKTVEQYHQLLMSKGTIGNLSFSFDIGGQSNKTRIDVYNIEGFKLENIPVSQRTKEIYVDNYEKICRTAKFSGEFLKQFNGKRGVFCFKYTPSRGKNAGVETETYVVNGEGLIFLKDFSEITEIDGDAVVAKIERATNIITDISWQGIANEGGVALSKGKKPEELIRRIIEWSTNPGDIVLDYHVGTGTTAGVAHKMSRRYLGIEQLSYGENDAVVRLRNAIDGDQTGISKNVDWKGGGSFVYAYLKNDVNVFIEAVRDAKNGEELLKLLDTVLASNFLSYRVDPKKLHKEEFKKLSNDEQKSLLIELVEKNKLYVNYQDLNDESYKIDENTKKLNKWMQSKE